MYEVIEYFTDLQDHNYPYHVGDTFPRGGLKVSEERLKELSSKNNKRGMQLIKLVENAVAAETEYSKTQINRMGVAELRELAKNCGIEESDNLAGGVLKKLLIEHFKL